MNLYVHLVSSNVIVVYGLTVFNLNHVLNIHIVFYNIESGHTYPFVFLVFLSVCFYCVYYSIVL